MITIKKIAEEAGVSPTTVSNVLYGRTQKVSPDTVKRVQTLLDDHNYIPRLGLNALTNRKSKMIGVLINTPEFMERTPFEKPFYGYVVGTLEKVFREEGYYLMICSAKDMQEIMRMVLGWNVDGVITVSMPGKYYQQTKEMTGKPVVSIDMDVEDVEKIPDCYNVTSKDFEAGANMMRYLLKNGVEDVIYIANTKMGVDYKRYQGADSVYKEYFGSEKELKRELLGRTSTERKHLYNQLAKYRGENTALFFSTDLNAVEAIGFFNEKGIVVPDEISVVGCDDEIYAQLSAPRLTTMRVESIKKAELAADMLLRLIDGENVKKKRKEIDVRLIERESVRHKGHETIRN